MSSAGSVKFQQPSRSVVRAAAVQDAAAPALLAAIVGYVVRSEIEMPKVTFDSRNSLVSAVVSEMPSLEKPYFPTPFLPFTGHAQTIFAALLRRVPDLQYEREMLAMEDGGVVALDFALPVDNLPPDAPVMVLLHGLTGGSQDSYIKYYAKAALDRGMRPVVFNSRGCADVPLATAQFYSASYTGDVRVVIDTLHARYPQAPMYAAGWSLGANILLRYLGEAGSSTPLRGAISLANPFNLVTSSRHFGRAFQRHVYDRRLAFSMGEMFKRNAHLFRECPRRTYDMERALAARTVREWDHYITRVTFGWPSVDDYYAGSSSSLSVPHITIPTLCIQALDDPIAPAEAIPFDAIAANPNIALVTTKRGGHVAWCDGWNARGAPWTDRICIEWLDGLRRHAAGAVLTPSASRPVQA